MSKNNKILTVRFDQFLDAQTWKMLLPSRRNANFCKIDIFKKSAKNHHFEHPQNEDFHIFPICLPIIFDAFCDIPKNH